MQRPNESRVRSAAGPRAAALLLAAALPAQGDGANLWSLRPLAAATAPIEPARIDALVDAALREHGLSRRPPADRRTLLRRAALLLTGLPPTPADVAAFAADPRDDAAAFAARVDELLASLACAEHLARRWLDLARYSDSNGLDENLAFGSAWRYRDWVVRALHDDLPFDRFGTMQLAGDLLPDDAAPLADRLVATGFLALGPRMLAEQDKDKLALDTVDEQVDLVGRTFLGLTLGCARCHDHKFDPVPTRDYYALAGIFKSTQSFENLDHVSRWVERPLATPAEIAARERALAASKASADALAAFDHSLATGLQERLADHIADYLLAGLAAGEAAILREAESAQRTNLHRDDDHWGSKGCAVLHTTAAGVQFADYEIATAAGPWRLDVRMASKESRPLRVLVDGEVRIERTLAETTGDWFPAQQAWFCAGTLELTAGPHVLRLEGTGPHMPHLDKWSLAPAPAGAAPWPGAIAQARGLAPAAVRNAAFLLRDPARALGRAFQQRGDGAVDASATAGAQQQALAAAWRDHAARQAASKDPLPLAADLDALLGPGGVFELRDDELPQLLDGDGRARRDGLVAQRDRDRDAVPAAPPLAMGVSEGKPVDLPVHLRGSHLTLAPEPTPRGFPSALAGVVPAPAIAKDHSGRLELAQWIFDARNPLTPRVHANRCWQLLFGEGLARSESNFGVRGEPPTHPQLLDELAASLLADGWSTRRLLRRILLTATWQQQSAGDDTAATVDPDDRWLWRQRRQRLPAEAIRDSILAVAGTLDRTAGGSLLGVDDRAYVTNDQSNDRARYDVPRRSLYLPVIRNAMYDLFLVFDYADPSVHLEQRPQSAVATQALLLLNSPFVREQARALADAAVRAQPDGDDDARIDWIWQRAFQRLPSRQERTALHAWLAAAPSAHRWPGLCQTVFAANEFVYVD